MLMVEIKDDAWDNGADTRLRADDRMPHRRYDATLPDRPLPRLYGLSLLGTFISVTSLPAKLSQIVQKPWPCSHP